MKFVRPEENKDNTLIFITHKEYERITGYLEWKLITKIAFIVPYILIKFKSVFIRQIFKSIKSKNNAKVIVHWGVTLNNAIHHDKNICDLHMTDIKSSNLLNAKIGKKIAIPMLSKDFDGLTKLKLTQNNSIRKWDLITVSHNSRRKKLEDILMIIRKAMDINPKLTSLLVVNTPSSNYRRNSHSSSIKFLDMYKSLFTYKERNQIVLLRVSDELGLEGISPLFIRYLMSNSSNFIFASVSEGSAKVVKEAFDSGCYIFARKGLKGGSYDDIPDDSIYLWENFKECADAICKQVTHASNSLDIPNIQINHQNVNKLLSTLEELNIIENNLNYDLSEFEFANRWLPAHFDIPKGRVTSDILGLRDWISAFLTN